MAFEVHQGGATTTELMRSIVRMELASIEPLDDLERAHREDALAWVDSGAELCRVAKPAIPPKHLVSYFAIVDGEYILLVDHRNAKLWLPPGGHVEPGEHPREAVVRELHEELRLVPPGPVASPLLVTCTTTVGVSAGHIDVSLWYVVLASRATAVSFDEQEFHAVRWFALDEVPYERADPNLRRFVAKLRAHRALASHDRENAP
jgi:ADP-ribose pyrophosphatase YjhB (NUDIX family)